MVLVKLSIHQNCPNDDTRDEDQNEDWTEFEIETDDEDNSTLTIPAISDKDSNIYDSESDTYFQRILRC